MNNLNENQVLEIKNQIHMERFLIQKYQTITNLSQNDKLRNVCQNITDSHKTHFYRLKSILDNNL